MRAELPALHSCLTGGCSQEQCVALRAQMTSDRTRGDSPGLHQGGWAGCQDFLTERAARPWKGQHGGEAWTPLGLRRVTLQGGVAGGAIALRSGRWSAITLGGIAGTVPYGGARAVEGSWDELLPSPCKAGLLPGFCVGKGGWACCRGKKSFLSCCVYRLVRGR